MIVKSPTIPPPNLLVHLPTQPSTEASTHPSTTQKLSPPQKPHTKPYSTTTKSQKLALTLHNFTLLLLFNITDHQPINHSSNPTLTNSYMVSKLYGVNVTIIISCLYTSLNHTPLNPNRPIEADLGRFKSTEGFFDSSQWGLDTPSLPSLIRQAITQCPIDYRRQLWRLLGVVGGLWRRLGVLGG